MSLDTFQGIDWAMPTHALPNLTLRSFVGPEWGVPKNISPKLLISALISQLRRYDGGHTRCLLYVFVLEIILGVDKGLQTT
jgi:hypothetical protein